VTDGTIRVWEVANSADTSQLQVGESDLTCVAVSPDGKLIATGEDYGKVRIWDTRTGTQRKAFDWLERVRFVRFSNDGVYVVTADHSDPVAMFTSGLDTVTLRTRHLATGASSADAPKDLDFSWERPSTSWIIDSSNGHTAITSRDSNTPVAFLAETLELHDCNPTHGVFAGISLGNLHIYTLEEEPVDTGNMYDVDFTPG
jgi:WD40 repeat protein